MSNRFRFYSIFAWGTAAAVTIVAQIFQTDNTDVYVTDSPNTSCLFYSKYLIPYYTGIFSTGINLIISSFVQA
jgi:hypothetical protein